MIGSLWLLAVVLTAVIIAEFVLGELYERYPWTARGLFGEEAIPGPFTEAVFWANQAWYSFFIVCLACVFIAADRLP